MSRKRSSFGFVVVAALIAGVAVLGWTMLGSGDACRACGRPIHHEALTIGLDAGQTETYCCLTCALTHHQQSGETVEVVELRDYQTGQALSPEQAYIVRESDVNLCTRHAVLADREGVSTMEFDRCSPSMLAFGTREQAAEFQRQHGGILLPFSQMHRAFETP